MNKEALLEIVNDLLSSNGDESYAIKLNVDELKELYDLLLRRLNQRTPKVSIINFGDSVIVGFLEISGIIIFVENIGNKFSRDDFDFLSLTDWYGGKDFPIGFGGFLRDEIRLYWKKLIGLILIVILILSITTPQIQVIDFWNELLLQASTLFFSIYLIFTVSQSERLSKDEQLFDSGTLNKYYAHDKNITKFAISTIAVVLINSAISHSPLIVDNTTANLNLAGILVIYPLIGLSVIMLFHTFYLVSNYYLERSRDLSDRDHKKRILELLRGNEE